jgi:hypothetical protein
MFELDVQRREELVENWARRIVERGLATPAVFLLEAQKPLAGLGAHALTAFAPLISSLLPVNAGELAAFVRDVDNLERLLCRIEQLEEARHQQQAADQRRATEIARRARRIRKLRRQRAAAR